MKKVLFSILFILLVFNSKIVDVNAYTCAYKFDYRTGIFGWNKESATVEFTIDTTNKTISYPEGFFDLDVYFLDYYVNSKYTTEYIVDSLNGGCVKNIIIGGISHDSGIFAYAIFFEESNYYQLEEKKPLIGKKYRDLPSNIYIDKYPLIGQIFENAVDTGEYAEDKSTGKLVEANFGCDYFEVNFERLQELKCKKEGVSCNISEIEEYNSKKEKLKSFCSSVTKNGNWGINYCLKPCLTLQQELSKYEDTFYFSDCGFSGRLIQFIANIIKWVKYIIPVIVIVLGILDFIQAISADKDDEMKKAQGRFVRRLIAAALIFIIPFILEFVLNKMGFDANGCGIIDL